MSISPDWFKYQYIQVLALMSQITVAHSVLTHNEEDLTLSKLRQDIAPAKGVSNLKQLSHHSSNTINPLPPMVFKHPTEQIFLFANTEINISRVTTHLVIPSMIHLHFNVHFLSNFEGMSPKYLTNVKKVTLLYAAADGLEALTVYGRTGNAHFMLSAEHTSMDALLQASKKEKQYSIIHCLVR
jgi:hypothetical protein